MKAHKSFALSLGDKARLGMLYARLGGALEYRDKLKEAYEYSYKGLRIGEMDLQWDLEQLEYAIAGHH